MFRKIIISIIAWASVSIATAGPSSDLQQLATECIQAAKQYKPVQKNYPYKVLHTVQYKGWIGDRDHFALTHSVIITIKYAGNLKEGYYWLRQTPQKRYKLIATSDAAGNFSMVQILENGNQGDIFQGLMKNGVIKGLWKTNDGEHAYALYATALEK